MTRSLGVVGLVLCLALSGCSAGAAATPALTEMTAPAAASAATSVVPTVSDERSVVVIGHSGATGYDSDPTRPGVDVTANSWATGTNPSVDSILLRLGQTDPRLRGNGIDLAVGGSDVGSLIDQATRAVGIEPTPVLVLVQSIDNDIRCDGTDAENYEPYRKRLKQVLDILTEGLPDARVFFVSQWADVRTYDKVVQQVDPSHITGSGPCDPIAPGSTKIDRAKEAYLQGVVDTYFRIITETCALYPACRTDEGAMQSMALTTEDLASDMNHLSVAGQAKMAALVFAALSGD
jgi:hypothetical protein